MDAPLPAMLVWRLLGAGSIAALMAAHRAADAAPDGFQILADEFAHRFALEVVVALVVGGKTLAQLMHFLEGRDRVGGHVVQQQSETLRGQRRTLENQGLFLALILQGGLGSKVSGAELDQRGVLLEELGQIKILPPIVTLLVKIH